MPQLIPCAEFSHKLGLYSKNSENTATFMCQGVDDFSLSGFSPPVNYRLVKSLTGEQYRIITIEKERWYTAYAVKLVNHKDITYPYPAVTQVMVWRSPSSLYQSVVSGFPQLFFKSLLEKTRIVVSDSEQTGDGQRFWLTMLDWAFHQGYFLYVADGTQSVDWVHYPINTLEELEVKWLQYAWGYDKDIHPHRRLVISKQRLGEA